MNKTKPPKQLVSKGQYVRVMGQKIGRYTLAAGVGGIGAILFLVMVCIWLVPGDGTPVPPIVQIFSFLVFLCIPVGLF
ncbi:MAG TPA: hypothetical protein VKU00_12720 [Chthonomonadaceae bacterium]|nr:hypothetical protein [Chthonomonadaceae bacterium]